MCGDPFYTKIIRGLVASAHAHGRQTHFEFVVPARRLARFFYFACTREPHASRNPTPHAHGRRSVHSPRTLGMNVRRRTHVACAWISVSLRPCVSLSLCLSPMASHHLHLYLEHHIHLHLPSAIVRLYLRLRHLSMSLCPSSSSSVNSCSYSPSLSSLSSPPPSSPYSF